MWQLLRSFPVRREGPLCGRKRVPFSGRRQPRKDLFAEENECRFRGGASRGRTSSTGGRELRRPHILKKSVRFCADIVGETVFFYVFYVKLTNLLYPKQKK